MCVCARVAAPFKRQYLYCVNLPPFFLVYTTRQLLLYDNDDVMIVLCPRFVPILFNYYMCYSYALVTALLKITNSHVPVIFFIDLILFARILISSHIYFIFL